MTEQSPSEQPPDTPEAAEAPPPVEQEAERRSHPGEVVRALARAARSFITYDARNETVRRMIGDYRETVELALEKHGELELEVRPFELVWAGEVVYSEPDRERSLAFRLFRDGVRAVIIKPGVPWDELLRLLEVLSIRYVGIRQHEDDTLTLLRQADFKSVAFRVVEAYVPSEEQPEDAKDLQVTVQQLRPPADWDQPLPRLDGEAPLQYREITADELAKIQGESTPDAMVEAARQVVREALSLAARANNAKVTADVLTVVEEICKYLIVELRPADLVWALRETRAKLKQEPGVERLTEQFGQGEVLDRFLRDPEDISPEELMPLFSIVGGEQLERVIDRFTREESAAVRSALKTILARLAAGNPDALLNHLGDVPTNRVVDLFNVVCVVAPVERVMEAAYSLAQHTSPEVKLGAMEVLAGAPVDTRFHETFETLLACEAPRVRVKATNIYGRRGGSRAFTRLRDQLEAMARDGSLEPVEAAALGQGLMLSSKEAARPLLRQLARPGSVKGVVQRMKFGEGYRMLRWAAVSGLGQDHGSDKSREAVEWLAKRADDELRVHCEEALRQLAPPEARQEPDDG